VSSRCRRAPRGACSRCASSPTRRRSTSLTTRSCWTMRLHGCTGRIYEASADACAPEYHSASTLLSSAFKHPCAARRQQLMISLTESSFPEETWGRAGRSCHIQRQTCVGRPMAAWRHPTLERTPRSVTRGWECGAAARTPQTITRENLQVTSIRKRLVVLYHTKPRAQHGHKWENDKDLTPG